MRCGFIGGGIVKKIVYIILATLFLCGLWSWRGGEAKGQTISPPTGELWLEVDQASQLLRIMRGSVPIRITLISSGKPATPTPNGTFAIQNRGKFFSVGYASAKYYTSFKGWGRYMFHSILYDAKGREILPKAAERLGTKDSHGCIRLPLHDAVWIYNFVPKGTRVKIFGGVATAHPKAFRLEVDGKKVAFGKQPRWIAGKLYVPARDIGRWMGWKVGWDSNYMTVSLVDGEDRLELPVSIPQIKVSGTQKQLKLPAFLIYKTTWVPFDDVTREMGYKTIWQGSTLMATKEMPVTSGKVIDQPTIPGSVYSGSNNVVTDTVYLGRVTVPSVVYTESGR
jgi:hypothetical protein